MPSENHELDALLAEQVAYYRTRAPGTWGAPSTTSARGDVAAAERELLAKLEAIGPFGSALDLACGAGTWTGRLLRAADSVTAIDASPEMLELAAARVHDDRVRFLQADLFPWTPDQSYDFAFFGFWLSHVPLERFERFWAMVASELKPGGQVFFVDDTFRTDDELIAGADSSTISRKLDDGTAFRAVKVPHEPAQLERRLAELGWRIRVHRLPGPFFWGTGLRTYGA
jgi:SAM-dependent methyltransferase